ncbi:hypothetical protein Avbf_13984 [Armadillidium vulgare]|nr:hypothetical protein Avbf_13984 [Armadillidium vulgare]
MKSVTKVIRIFRRSRRSYVSIVLGKPTRAFWETVSHYREMSCGSRSRLMLKLAAKHNEQNATVWQRLPNNSEEDTLHDIPMRTDGTKNLHYTSVGTDCNDPNRNPTSNTISSKSDEENSFNDFDSDDTDADPNFVDSSSESSGSSSSDIEYAEREMKERADSIVVSGCSVELSKSRLIRVIRIEHALSFISHKNFSIVIFMSMTL